MDASYLNSVALPNKRCEKCGVAFRRPWQLRRHLEERAKPCAPKFGMLVAHVGITAPAETKVKLVAFWNARDKLPALTASVLGEVMGADDLRDYWNMKTRDMADHEKAAPHVVRLLCAAVERAHADVQYRNVHLCPKRADHARVRTVAGWESVTLTCVVRALVEEVAQRIKNIVLALKDIHVLPAHVREPGFVNLLVLDSGRLDEYVDMCKAPMAAHLENMRAS